MRTLWLRLIDMDRGAKRGFQIAADCILVVLCFSFAMWLRLESAFPLDAPSIWISLVPVVLATVVLHARLGLYRAVIRHLSGGPSLAVALSAVVSGSVLFASSQVLGAPVPRSVPIIFALLMLITVGGLRLLMRQILNSVSGRVREPVVIYGAGAAGRQLASALLFSTEYVPVAFIDDDTRIHGTSIAGKPVYPARDAARVIRDSKIKVVLLALPLISRTRRREITESLEPLGVAIKTTPGIADLVTGKTTFNELRNVTPDDLLGREPVPPDDALMSRNVRGKVVLISGAGGSIGSELCRQVIRSNPSRLILLEHSEFALYQITHELRELGSRSKVSTIVQPVLGSVQDRSHLSAVLSDFGVDTIFHAAAYKHVAIVEDNLIAGIQNNVFGTLNLAEAAVATGVRDFILVSTDKAVRPTNCMGATKRLAELICQAMDSDQPDTTFSIVRFGNVLGSSGSVIPRFREQIENGGPVTVTHRDVTRYFMTIREAAQLVVQAGSMARGGDLFVLDMGQPENIFDLAVSMIRLHGLRPFTTDPTVSDLPETGDIEIRFIGLSQGEKLYEELLIGEDPCRTSHPRIMMAREVALSRAEVDRLLDELQRACDVRDTDAALDILRRAPLGFDHAVATDTVPKVRVG